MSGIMGYKYPFAQGHIYSISEPRFRGYICPMEMKFIDALKLAMKVTKRASSMREVAIATGISYDILKNVSQGKSEKPNAEAAMKVAEFFGVSLSDFYAGNFDALSAETDASLSADVAKVTGALQSLSKENRLRVQAFAEALRLSEGDGSQSE